MPAPVSARPRAGRRRKRRRVAWGRLAALALGLGVLAALAWALTSRWLGVTRIEVMGARTVPNSLIVWQAGIPEGANIVLLRPGRVARRVAALPAIASATVGRRPPHGVVIRVAEREAVLSVQGPNGPLYVDPQGICFERCWEESKGVELLGIPAQRFVPGRRVSDRRVRTALQTYAGARKEGLTPTRVALGPAGETELLLAGGPVLRLGEPRQLEEKLHQARLALQALKHRGPIEYVDVSCPDAIVWKPARPPAQVMLDGGEQPAPQVQASAPAAKAVP